MWVHYPIIGVPYPVCWPALVAMLAMLELEVVLQLELDQDHVAAPPSGHQPGPTHRDAPLLLCLPAAPGCSGKCCVQAGLPLADIWGVVFKSIQKCRKKGRNVDKWAMRFSCDNQFTSLLKLLMLIIRIFSSWQGNWEDTAFKAVSLVASSNLTMRISMQLSIAFPWTEKARRGSFSWKMTFNNGTCRK